MADYFRKWRSLYSSTTNSFGTGESETITPSSVSGLPTDTEMVLTFDREIPGKLERIKGTISGGNFVVSSGGRGYDGTTEQAHTSPTVEHVVNASDINDMVTGILVGHTQTGVHKASAVYDTPDFNGTQMIVDADGDSSITADTDDQIDFKLSTADRYKFKIGNFDMVDATTNIQVAGADPKRGLYIDAAAMKARASNGAASSSTETSTNKVMKTGFAFDKDADEFVQFKIPAPKYWDLGTITATPYWTADAGTTGTVAFAVQALALSNDDALDTAFGTAQTSTDTFIATGDVHVAPTTSAITVGGTPAKDDILIFQVYRDVSEDDFDADAILLGLHISFSVSQFSDA